MTTPRYRLAGELHALADALDGVEGLADSAVQLGIRCPSEAELEGLAGLLGVEVQADSRGKVAQGQFGPVRLVAFADRPASGPGGGCAMTMLEMRQARQDQATESGQGGRRLVMKSQPRPPRKQRLGRTAGLPRSAGEERPARDVEPSREVRALVMARDGYACPCCGTSVVARPHSVLRRSRDDGDSPANLLTFLGRGENPLDPADHRARVDSRRDPTDAARGFTVPSGQDPALVPVAVSGQAGWITLWLTAEGACRTEPPPGAV